MDEPCFPWTSYPSFIPPIGFWRYSSKNLNPFLACCASLQSSEGNVAVVEYLMRQGAGIHMRDRNNDTPLLCAIKAGHRDVVRSLVSCGAHLQKGSLELGKDQYISWMPNQM